MKNILAIFIGGGFGAIFRYLTGIFFSNIVKSDFPLSTFIVNIIGCFIIGFLFIFFIDKTEISNSIKLLLCVGFCGGLTTFSTFSLEIYNMIINNQIYQALTYIFLSVLLGLFAVILGGYFAKLI